MSAVPEETEVTPTPEPPPASSADLDVSGLVIVHVHFCHGLSHRKNSRGSSNRDGAGDLVRVLGADTASREDGKSKDGYCKDCSETGFGKAF